VYFEGPITYDHDGPQHYLPAKRRKNSQYITAKATQDNDTMVNIGMSHLESGV
jgi:hypothetical protein